MTILSKIKSDFSRSLADADGNIDPIRVFEAARDPSSPIHDEYNWNLEAAARERWIERSKELIRFVRLEVQIERVTIIAPYYVPHPDRAPRDRRYMPLTQAIGQRDRALAILEDEFSRIVAAIERAKAIALVLGITPDLDAMLATVASIKARASASRSGKPGKTAKKTSRPRKGPKKTPGGKPSGKPRRRGQGPPLAAE